MPDMTNEEQQATERRAEAAARAEGWSVSTRDKNRFVDFDGNYLREIDAGDPDAWTRLCEMEGIEIDPEERTLPRPT